jgi:hypothetical protein
LGVVSFVIAGFTVSTAKLKQVTGSPQQKVVNPDPPGTINGATNPEPFSDHAAWAAMLALIASQKTRNKKRESEVISNCWG